MSTLILPRGNQPLFPVHCADLSLSDPLPWRSLFRHAEDCLSARFVDIDCLEVMAPKCEIVKRTPELIAPLTALEFPENSHVLLRSDQYCQVACDLRHLTEIDKALLQVIDIHGSEILFIAEVSMAHMEVEAADALIHWAGAIGDAEFCLLEHILPDGPSSPFAHAMLQHFAKLNTPVKSVERYPTVNSQRKRFKTLGWPNSRAQSLWGAWSDPLYISPTQRRALDKVEAFDEWEEFVHFASHYCVLHAQTAELWPETFSRESSTAETDLEQFPTTGIDVIFSPTIAPKSVSPRRFGAPLLVQTVLGQQAVVNIFGHGIDGHLRSCDLYCKSADSDAPSQIILPQGGPGARSYFTLTDLGDYGYLLAGGKGSPAAPFNDCWVFKKDANQWIETHSLPVPLFRHAVERLGNSKLVLLAGGRLDSTTVHSGFLVYHPTVGWVRCVIKGTLQPPALSGCLLSCSTALRPNPFAFHGILAGGMTADGIVSNEVLKWVLNVSKPTEPTITFEPTVSRWPAQLLARYGASSARVGDWVVVAGGVAATGTVPTQQGVVRFRAYGEKNETYECLEYTHKLGPKAPRPFFIGTSIVAVDSFEVAIIGGGTPCFSTETGWSHGIYTFDTRASPSCAESVQKRAVWKYSKTPTVTNEASTITRDTSLHHIGLSSTTPIPRIELNSAEHFGSILQSGRPVVFQNLELGRCLAEWSLAYLAEHVGPGRKVRRLRSYTRAGGFARMPMANSFHFLPCQVVVHESTNQAMDFLSKNFRYKTQTFQEFARDIDDGKKLYLRALSADKPSNSPAKLNVDFPTIAKDFVLPPHLAFVEDKQFSSVLRISGPVNMWLHYDVSFPHPRELKYSILRQPIVYIRGEWVKENGVWSLSFNTGISTNIYCH